MYMTRVNDKGEWRVPEHRGADESPAGATEELMDRMGVAWPGQNPDW